MRFGGGSLVSREIFAKLASLRSASSSRFVFHSVWLRNALTVLAAKTETGVVPFFRTPTFVA